MAKDFAVIKLNSKQFLVEKGSKIETDRVSKDSDVAVLLAEVGGKEFIGEPNVSDIGVSLEVIEDKNNKMEIRRFRSKSGYRRKRGHKQPISVVEVKDIKKGIKTGIK